MTNTLRYPLRNISPDTTLDLQEKYPNASVRIELNDQPVEGGLSEEAFWVLIAQLDWSKEGQDEAVIEPVVVLLAASPLRPLYDFKDILSRKLYLLDTEAHAQHLGESAYGAEADHFSPVNGSTNRSIAIRNRPMEQRPTISPPMVFFPIKIGIWQPETNTITNLEKL